MRPTEGEAQPRTGAALAAPLYLIHTTKSPNPSPARVSARFGVFKHLLIAELFNHQKPQRISLGQLMRRADDVTKS